MIGASQEVKNYSFRSLKEVVYILGTTTKTLQKNYHTDEKRFFEKLSKAFQIKYLEEKDGE